MVHQAQSDQLPDDNYEGVDLLELAVPIARQFKLLVLAPLLAGAVALAASYLIEPTFTATTTFLPPQQQPSTAASALASLGALSGLAGISGAGRTAGDQYVALMQSTTVADRLVEAFGLVALYDVKYRFEARKKLAQHVRIVLGKKDGLITVDVDDTSPQRAADMANRYVEELRLMTGSLALTEAQQRRVFFEAQLKQTRDKLTAAQQLLESSGYSAGALRSEPRAAAEGYARLRAEVTAAEVRLQTLRRGLTDGATEVQQQQTTLDALRRQLAKLESNTAAGDSGDYVGKYREFKYQETLFELFSRQYELARLDESREGTLIQVVDVAAPPEYKSKPERTVIAVATTFIALLALIGIILIRHFWREASKCPARAKQVSRLRAAFRWR